MNYEVGRIKLFVCSCFRYPEARAIQRKIIFHSGPTNSGKTYHAIQRYLSARSGVYCGPLKLLAHEIFEKSNAAVSTLPSIYSFPWSFSSVGWRWGWGRAHSNSLLTDATVRTEQPSAVRGGGAPQLREEELLDSDMPPACCVLSSEKMSCKACGGRRQAWLRGEPLSQKTKRTSKNT